MRILTQGSYAFRLRVSHILNFMELVFRQTLVTFKEPFPTNLPTVSRTLQKGGFFFARNYTCLINALNPRLWPSSFSHYALIMFVEHCRAENQDEKDKKASQGEEYINENCELPIVFYIFGSRQS